MLATTDRAGYMLTACTDRAHPLRQSLAQRHARAHNTIAHTLETLLGDNPGERTAKLAYHWAALRSNPATRTKAVHYAQLAGDRALTQLAPDQAVRWYGQALELLDRMPHPDDRQHAELLVGLGEAQRQSGIAAHRETLLAAAYLADQIDNIDMLVRAVLANNRGYNSTIGVGDHERIAGSTGLSNASAPHPPRHGPNFSPSPRPNASSLSTSPHGSRSPTRRSRSPGPAATAPASPGHSSARTIRSPTRRRYAQRVTSMKEACVIADELADPATQFWVHNGASINALERGDAAAIDEHLQRSEAFAARIPHATIRWTLTFHGAWVAGLHGDLAEFERLAETALNVGLESGQSDTFTIYGAQLTNGQPSRADARTDPSGRASARRHAHPLRLPCRPRATRTPAGHIDQAQAMVGEDLAAAFPMPDDTGWSTGFTYWVEAPHSPASSTRRRYTRATPPISRPDRDHVDHRPPSHLSLPRTRRPSRRPPRRRGTMVRRSTRNPPTTPVPAAGRRTQAAWAAMLADRNEHDDHHRARVMAHTALDAAVTGGYGYIETDARAVLDRLS